MSSARDPLDLPVRALSFERRNELRLGSAFAFGWDEGLMGDGPDPHFDALHEAERTRCVFDGDEVVGTLAVFSLNMTVPGGGSVATAGTTAVTVRPTHRRRRLLRKMMASHFEDVLDRGEPLAALWASESGIYRRFGFGCAASMSEEQICRDDTAFIEAPPPAGRCRMIDADEAMRLLPPLFDRFCSSRAGLMARTEAWWRHRILRDASYDRHGGTPLRRVVYEADGEPQGYLLYRSNSDGDGDERQVHVVELAGLDGEAEKALYGVACNVDFVDEIVLWNQPVESPLSLLLEDPRMLQRKIRDALWVRLMDVPRALAARTYTDEGRITFGLRDSSLPDNEGSYSLDASPSGADCTRTKSADADIEMDVADLGAAYLGGMSFRALARAGRARGSDAALARADALFATDPPPWNMELF
jgi:predicted acetyltransferase